MVIFSTMRLSFSSLLVLYLFFILMSSPTVYAGPGSGGGGGEGEACLQKNGECNNKAAALRLKVMAIVSILATSLIGVCLPLFSKSVPALGPDRNPFIIVKSLASGSVLATGFMHVLPYSFDALRSQCLPKTLLHKFPFPGFVAMVSAIVTLMVASIATSLYNKQGVKAEGDHDTGVAGANGVHGHGHHGLPPSKLDSIDYKVLLPFRVIAMVYNACTC